MAAFSYVCTSAAQVTTPAAGTTCANSAGTVAAFNPLATQANGGIPGINGIAFYQNNGLYSGWAVGDSGLVYTASFSMANATATITNLLPVTSWTVFNQTGAFNTAVYTTGANGYNSVSGIVWCAAWALLVSICCMQAAALGSKALRGCCGYLQG